MSILRSDIIQNVTTSGKTGWCQNNFNPQKGFFSAIQSGLALNAMPTPFARAEVVMQAFNAISDPAVSVNFSNAGYTYQQLVSDTLDILEMLYDYNLYEDQLSVLSCRLSQLNFPITNEIEENGRSKSLSFLKESLNAYKEVDDVYFVIYNDGMKSYVLAMSCPETLFFTTSRLDRNNGAKNEYDLEIQRKDNSGEAFFSKPRSLSERSKNFQDYLYNLYVTNRNQLGNTAFGRFINAEFGSNRNNSFDSKSVAVLKDNSQSEVRIPMTDGTSIVLGVNSRPQSAALIREKLINVGFNINSEKFVTINNWASHLLPIDLTALSKVSNPESVINNLTVTHSNVTTLDSAGNKYEFMATETKVEDIIPFDLGVYPFFRYPETFNAEGKNTYNVVMTYQYGSAVADNAIELSFFTSVDGKIVKLNTYSREEFEDARQGIKAGVIREVRTNTVSSAKKTRTLHYTIVGAQFDYIQVDFNLTDLKASGVLKPKFNMPVATSDKMKFAIDFGTTSTYIAARRGDNSPTVFTTGEQSMVFLHANPSTDNRSKVYKHEEYKQADPNKSEAAIPEMVKFIKNEFVPSSIDNEVYKFPMRTAMSRVSASKPVMFANTNIAFTYDREPALGSNDFITNIKWDTEDNGYTRLFIRQIIRMCVLHALSEGCSLENVEFLYFYPLAMNEDTYNEIQDAWEKGCAEYGLSASAATSMTESLAPYYAAPIDDASCVVSVDIGGGSVDTVVYKDRNAQFAFSALFGCDVLWSGGKNMASNDKNNPIYQRLKPEMERVNCQADLKTIQSEMTKSDSAYCSSQIINFWLSNDNVFDVSKKLQASMYKPVYVCHFYAILYHVAQTMKVNNIEIPAEITLSGNGSTYLNYINRILSDVAVAAFKDVYGECDRKIKVTLPKERGFKGKEMAAIGGLNYNLGNEDQVIIDEKNFIYLGEEIEKYNAGNAEDRELVMSESGLVEPMVQTICENVMKMEAGLRNLLHQLRIDVGDFSSTLSEYRTTLKDIVEDRVQGKLYVSPKKIESTLFFVPIRQMIFKVEQSVKQD